MKAHLPTGETGTRIRVASSISTVRDFTRRMRDKGISIGLVPTMGFLHAGHLSLIKASKAECECVILSVFVNPTQFGPDEDLEAYPRDSERDLEIAAAAEVDMVFMPNANEMYGEDCVVDMTDPLESNRCVTVAPGSASNGLCGDSRPGHFRGVTTIVAKLLNIAGPDRIYMGRKDAQQAAVIGEMINDLDFPVQLRVMSTIREEDGLALSSRNAYLTHEQRNQASSVYAALKHARQEAMEGETDPGVIQDLIWKDLELSQGVEAEYVAVVDADSMRSETILGDNSLAAVAVHVGKTRLIDNMFLLGEVER